MAGGKSWGGLRGRRAAPAPATERREATLNATTAEKAGRDPGSFDIAFSGYLGGSPGSRDFKADIHLEHMAHLTSLGVTWVQVGLPGDSLAHAIETAEQYGQEVIARA